MTRFLYALALAALIAPGARAQTCTTSWTNPAGGAWETAANWSDGVPDAADVVCITLGGTYTVSQSSANRTIAGLVVGGASGTQTLTTFNVFTVTGDARVTPSGRWEVLNRTPGGTDGVYTTGTILVEGELVQNGGTSFLTTGGVLDVAPGGVYRLITEANAGAAAATFRIRGLLDGAGCTGTCQVGGTLDVQGGTLRASAGRLDLTGGGALHDATLDAAAGASLNFRRPGVFTVTGTLAGAPAGRVAVADAVFRAGVGDATLALGGTGLVFDGSSGVQFSTISSAGGRFINTGLLTWEDSFAVATAVVVENRGTLRSLEGVSLDQGARLLNRAGATWEIATSSAMGFGDGTVENAGLIVKTGAGSTNFGTGSGRLRNLPGAELRALNGRLDLAAPGTRTFPEGVTVTGTAEVLLPSTLDFEGTVSPGTAEQPVATLAVAATYRPSIVTGAPRLVVDVDAGGVSDVVAVSAGGGSGNVPRLAGTLVVRVRPGYTPAVGDQFTVFTSTRAMDGAFTQVVADGAPSGVAFVAEVAANRLSVVVRAVEAAPGGSITVTTTTPVGGGLRTLFLSGPGVVGVASARLECTDCLDAGAFGTIPATLVGAGTFKEARFDLTSPRAFGFYDLVLVQPGLPDTRVPITVRPYISYAAPDVATQWGMRVRPAGVGQDHNFSSYALRSISNTFESAVPYLRVHRPAPDRVSMILTSRHSVAGAYYNSATATDPLAPPLFAGRAPTGEPARFEIGFRVSPEDVLFPDQTPTGPDDPRLVFGKALPLVFDATTNASFERSAATLEAALRAAPHTPLQGYLAALDVADPTAVGFGVSTALRPASRAVNGPRGLLDLFLSVTGSIVTPPPGLAAAADDALGAALSTAVDAQMAAIGDAHVVALASASPAVVALYEGEVAALFPDVRAGPRAAVPPADRAGGNTPIEGLMCSLGFGDSIESIQSIGNGGGGGGGGGACPPPTGPYDPNDKTADTDLLCEFGTVLVDGQPETRCVRYYVPRARAADPVEYTIRFENAAIATAPAEFVTITDELDLAFNPASLEVIETSSDSTFSYSVTGRTVTFRWVGIDLPPNVTAPEGEGFVRFRVSPTGPLPDGTEIRNDASIVFDFNPPIETPEVIHEVRHAADVGVAIEAPAFAPIGTPLAFTVGVANVRGDPAEEVVLTISVQAPVVSVVPSAGTCEGTAPIVCAFGTLAEAAFATVEVVLAPAALGTLVVAAEATTSVFDAFAANDADAVSVDLVGVSTEDESGFPRELTLSTPRPNPSRGAVTLRWGLPRAAAVEARVFDLLGREVARLAEGEVREAGWHEVRWDAVVAAGVYVVQLRVGEETRTRRLTVLR